MGVTVLFCKLFQFKAVHWCKDDLANLVPRAFPLLGD